MAVNITFDPYVQNISLLAPDGVTSTTVAINDIFALQGIAVASSIVYGVQIGISAILLIVMVMLTKPEKRRSIVFILNSLALLLLFVEGILDCVTITGPFLNFYNRVEGYYVDVDQAIQVSTATEVLIFLIETTLELSMVFQVHVVCCTVQAMWRNVINAISAVVVLLVVAARFALLIANIDYSIVHVADETEQQGALIGRIDHVHNICFVVSIYYFSGVFCSKLGAAIHRRRKMGMKQLGAIHIIFIMGCQTLLIPAILGILAFFVLQGSQLQALMYVVLAMFLPLSSLWAATATNHAQVTTPREQLRLRQMASKSSDGSHASSDKKPLTDMSTMTDTQTTGSGFHSPRDLDLER